MKNRTADGGFLKGAAVLLIATVTVKLIGALFKIPLSSKFCLGDLGFGYFSAAYDLLSPLYFLSVAGLPVAVSKTVAELNAEKKYRDVRYTLKLSGRLYFLIGLILTLVIWAVAYPFTALTDQTGKTLYGILAVAPSAFFFSAMSAYRGYYEGLCDMYPTALSQVIEAVGKLIFGFTFGFLTVRLTGNPAMAAAAAILGITLSTAFSFVYLVLRFKIKGDGISETDIINAREPDYTVNTVKTLLIIALPIALSSLSNNICLICDALFARVQLSGAVTASAETVREMYAVSIAEYNLTASTPITDSELVTLLYGIRGKAYTLYNLIPTLTAVIGVTAVPFIASFNAEGNKEGVKENTALAVKLAAFISFPAGFGFLFAGDSIMSLLYDTAASVEIGGNLLKIFGISAIFTGFVIPLTGVMQALGLQKKAVINILIGFAIKLIVGFLTATVPEINVLGTAISTLVAYLVMLVLHSLCVFKDVGKAGDKGNIFKPLLSALTCGIIARLILNIGGGRIITLIAVLAGGAVYFTALIILKFFNERDFRSFGAGERVIEFCKKRRIIR